MLQRRGLRRLGALHVAGAQRVLSPLHGLTGSVQIRTWRGALPLRVALRLLQRGADLRLPVREVVAALAALRIAATAAAFRLVWRCCGPLIRARLIHE